jgi:hypothetical protein
MARALIHLSNSQHNATQPMGEKVVGSMAQTLSADD